MEHFDGDALLDSVVDGFEHDAHAALADAPTDGVVANPAAYQVIRRGSRALWSGHRNAVLASNEWTRGA